MMDVSHFWTLRNGLWRNDSGGHRISRTLSRILLMGMPESQRWGCSKGATNVVAWLASFLDVGTVVLVSGHIGAPIPENKTTVPTSKKLASHATTFVVPFEHPHLCDSGIPISKIPHLIRGVGMASEYGCQYEGCTMVASTKMVLCNHVQRGLLDLTHICPYCMYNICSDEGQIKHINKVHPRLQLYGLSATLAQLTLAVPTSPQ